MSWNQSSVCAVLHALARFDYYTTIGFGLRSCADVILFTGQFTYYDYYIRPPIIFYLWISVAGGKCWHVWQPRNVKRTQQRVFSFTEPWNQNLFPSHPFGWPFCFPFYTSKHIDSSSSSRDCRSTGHRRLILFWTHESFFSFFQSQREMKNLTDSFWVFAFW